jgi:predicted DNA-binding transcriptional regulator YafY
VEIKMEISGSQAYRVYDEFMEHQVEKKKDGSFLVTFSYPEDEWVYGYIMSFGCFGEVLEPEHIRKIIKVRLQSTLEKYK